MNVFSRSLLGSVSLVLAAVAFAAPEKPVIVSAHVYCLSLGEPLTQLALIDAKGKPLRIEAPNSFLSPGYDYVGPAAATITRTDLAPDSPPAAQFSFPPQGGEFLLLFAPGQGGAMKVAPLDFSPGAVPSGHYLVWNISPQRLAFAFGEAKLIIEPGQNILVTPRAGDDTYVPLRVFEDHNGKPRLIVSGRHFNRANARQIFLFSASDNPNAPVKMQAITSLLPPPEAALPAGTKVVARR